MIKVPIHQEDTTIIHIYIHLALECLPHKVNIDRAERKNKMIAEVFNTLFWITQIENQKENHRLEQYYRPNGPNRHIQHIPPNSKEYIFFSSVHGTFFRIDHMLGD